MKSKNSAIVYNPQYFSTSLSTHLCGEINMAGNPPLYQSPLESCSLMFNVFNSC